MAGTHAARLKRCFSLRPRRAPCLGCTGGSHTSRDRCVVPQPMSLPNRAKPALAIGAPIYASVRRSPDHRLAKGSPRPPARQPRGCHAPQRTIARPLFARPGAPACANRLIRRPPHRTFGAHCSPPAPRPRMPVSRHPQPTAYYLLFATTVPGIVMVARQAPPLLQEPQEPMRKRKTIASLYISPSFGWGFLPH
ncbi:AGL309Wp [Eremothecium gossypii ATCC 10895]|uniref:AGL309Wp n=1 Tax=Eremothecium gossypii (strain ATCC 10895 / CBS 109.51 / FGSC 9923 / NRRL Y-1056) TaxID=284811 RepID=Q751L0_EREGS|nr:AGL309Wp [Eremothecium gossypii ATCC 10895]AAS54182.1 AGL309Wp [Eremothecium gossypii ATCC 10895]AEY98508.1 FAGL309Wp [Eremothecium gossypii FDAG1]